MSISLELELVLELEEFHFRTAINYISAGSIMFKLFSGSEQQSNMC
jgi:hypothetical protein